MTRRWMVAVLVFGLSTGLQNARSQVRRSLVNPVEDRIICLSATLGVPVARAFAYFSNNALLQAWLAPKASVNAKVGGPYELFWEPPNRVDNSTIGCRVTAAQPDQLLAFQWRSPKQFKPFANGADPLTHVVVSFAPDATDARKTRVILIHSGWRSTARWEEARRWQERAWRLALGELERVAR